MLSRIQNFIARHRRKFLGMAMAGAVILGGWHYISWKMQRSEEEYLREVLKKAKRHMHHKSSAQAAEKQVMALVPVAAKATNDALNTKSIVNQLKMGSKSSSKDMRVQSLKGDMVLPGPLTPEERVSKWEELKRVSIARAVAYAYIPSILIVFVRLQLGLLGGYVFKSCGGDNITAFLNGADEKQSYEENQESMPFEIQEAYLSLTQFFLEGQSTTVTSKLVDSHHESKDDFLVFNESYWSNHRGNEKEGKSKLNLGQPVASLKTQKVQHQKVNGIIGDVVRESDESVLENTEVQSLKNGVGNQSKFTDSGSVIQISVGANKSLVNEQGKSSVTIVDKGETDDCSKKALDEIPSVCSLTKSVPSSSSIVISHESIDSVRPAHEISTSVNAEEDEDGKDVSSRETAEEDSGRCSGTDDISEDEVQDVEKSKSGIEVLCSLLEDKVGTVVDKVSLKTPLSLAETETLFWGILTAIRSNPAEDPAFNLPKYLLPPPQKITETVQDIESHLSKNAAMLFNDMVSETADLLETKEVVELVQSCVSAGLGHIMDRLANYFPAENLSCDFDPLSMSTSMKREVEQKLTIPLAKLIPLISKVAFEEGTPWARQLLEMGNLKDFGANVYEAFTH